MAAFMEILQSADSAYLNLLIAIMRYLSPALALLLLLRCFGPLYTFRREPEIWGWLCMSDGTKLPITHWENIIGRNKRSDIVIDFPTVSRTHGVLTRYDDGSWTITDTDSSGGILVNGKKMDIPSVCLKAGDVITVRATSRKSPQFESKASGRPVPAWLTFDEETMTGKVVQIPSREDVDLEVKETLIVELYSK